MNSSTVIASPPKVRVAVATKGDGLVNQHFGHAKAFLIYDVNNGQAELVEQRSVEQYCHGQEEGPGDLSTIIDILSDCQGVLVAKIGLSPESRLKAAGIKVFQVYDRIETALIDFYQQLTTNNE